MGYDGDRLETWLLASAEEWRSETLINQFFTNLAHAEDPRRYLALFLELLHIPVDTLENIVQMIKSVEKT